MEVVASKMEDLARCVVRVLSDNVRDQKDSALPREAPSVLCLTLYNCNKSRTCWAEFGSTDRPKSYALSVHLSGRDQEICLRNHVGSTFFSLPAGSMLVTVGKQIQVSCKLVIYFPLTELVRRIKTKYFPYCKIWLIYAIIFYSSAPSVKQDQCLNSLAHVCP